MADEYRDLLLGVRGIGNSTADSLIENWPTVEDLNAALGAGEVDLKPEVLELLNAALSTPDPPEDEGADSEASEGEDSDGDRAEGYDGESEEDGEDDESGVADDESEEEYEEGAEEEPEPEPEVEAAATEQPTAAGLGDKIWIYNYMSNALVVSYTRHGESLSVKLPGHGRALAYPSIVQSPYYKDLAQNHMISTNPMQ